MSTANKIFTNTIWQVAIRAISILIGIINLGFITRILGATNFGFYTTIFAFVQMFMILADLGLYLTLLREVSSTDSKKDETKIVNNIFTIRLVSSLILLSAAPFVVQLFPYAPEVKTNLIYFLIAFFFQSLTSTLSAVFAKKFAMPKVALADLINKLLYLGILGYLFIMGGKLSAVLLGNSITQVIAFIIFFIFLRKYIKLRFAWDFIYWRQVMIQTWPLALTVVLNLVYFKADTLILSIFASPKDVGLYGAPYRILEVLTTFPHMFMGLILPLFTAAWLKKDLFKLRQIYQNSFDFFVMLTIGFMIVIWLASSSIMSVLAGSEFIASGPILNILIIATTAIYFGTLFTYLVVAMSLQKKMIKYFLISAIVGLVGYFILIPKFGYLAAAWMTVVVEVIIWIFAYWVVKKHVNLKTDMTVVWKSGEAAFAALFVGWLLHNFHPLIMSAVALLVYTALLYFLKAIDKQAIKQLLNKES
ncbi:flippase [bacterium]|jgi:O-antigen/teichoic acid export membrane protein|nr:flippase [bacterium]MBT4649182.1 flippase [bacterium]